MPPAPVSVRFVSPDPQVQIALHRPLDPSPLVTSKAGDVVTVAPGTYRVVEVVQPAGYLDGKDTPGTVGGSWNRPTAS